MEASGTSPILANWKTNKQKTQHHIPGGMEEISAISKDLRRLGGNPLLILSKVLSLAPTETQMNSRR